MRRLGAKVVMTLFYVLNLFIIRLRDRVHTKYLSYMVCISSPLNRATKNQWVTAQNCAKHYDLLKINSLKLHVQRAEYASLNLYF